MKKRAFLIRIAFLFLLALITAAALFVAQPQAFAALLLALFVLVPLSPLCGGISLLIKQAAVLRE